MAGSAPVQRDSELQNELFQLKEVFDNNLRKYEGDDPLENWYDYILKVEESYLKNGNTNNLIPLLEKCLEIFETDSRYISDRRICRLWIKYIDLQQNPVELYQLLYSKNLCIKCADFYCAWALYHEVAGNFKQANNVFEMGMWHFAQPYEELVIAHKNMVFMAGLHLIHGIDERRLNERRQVLISLHRNKCHQAAFYNACQPSVQGHQPSLPFLSNSATRHGRNDHMLPAEQNSACALSSGGLMDVIRSRENINQSSNAENASASSFQLKAEAKIDQPNSSSAVQPPYEGIRLYQDFYPTNHDDYSDWYVDICCPDPELPDKIPMYPKHLVYINGTEFSLEEIKSRSYEAKKKQLQAKQVQMAQEISPQDSVDHHMVTETEQAVQSIMSLGASNENITSEKSHTSNQNIVSLTQPAIPEMQPNFTRSSYYPNASVSNTYQDQDISKFLGFTPQQKMQQQIMNEKGDAQSNHSQQSYTHSTQSFTQNNSVRRDLHTEINDNMKKEQVLVQNWPNTSSHEDSFNLMKDVNDLWKDTIQESRVEVPEVVASAQSFQIHEDTRLLKDVTIKQDSMPQKTYNKTPFTVRHTDDQTASSRKQFHHKDNENTRKAFAIARENENYSPSIDHQLYEDKNLSSQQNKHMQLRNVFDSPNIGLAASNVNPALSSRGVRQFLSQPTPQSPHENARQHLFSQPATNSFVTPERGLPVHQGSIRSSGIRPFLSQPAPEPSHEKPRHLSQPDSEFARPLEVKKPTIDLFSIFEDNPPSNIPFNESCTTQTFNYNLKLSSTPFNHKKFAAQQYANELKNEETDHLKTSKQKLFSENPVEDTGGNEKWNVSTQNPNQEKLSVIYETTKEFCSSSGSSSSGGTTLKTTTFNAYSLKAIPENVTIEEHSRLANNTHHSKNYIQQNAQAQYSQVENKNFDLSQHSPSIYNQNQMNNSQLSLLRHAPRSDITEPSYRLNLQDDALNHLALKTQRTPSPKSVTLSYNKSVNVPNNHTVNNQSQQINYSSVIMRETIQDQSISQMQVKRPQFQNEQSYIYIADDGDTTKLTDAANLMQFSAGAENNSQLQSPTFNNSKIPKNNFSEHRHKDVQESPSKSQDGVFYEGSNDSSSIKDLWGRSPAKGSRMDIDAMSQNSNSELKMDYDSCPEPPSISQDETILQKTPSDPFSSKLIKALLRKIGFPSQRHKQNYVSLQSFPRLLRKENACLGDERYLVSNIIGKGTYGSVFKATRLSNNETVALKCQKPSNQWELYICNEIQHRVANPYLLRAFMSVQVGYFCPISSILVSEFCRYGSLLDISNKVKQVTGKGIKELVVIYFANEIVTIVNALHQCNIIHADIKPDNFLVTRMPPEFGHPCLQLIDFGCSIDMTLFPKDTTFTKVINTENFTCTEMKDGRPWTYQTDLFCMAATVHVLLFEKYIQLQKRGTVWTINNRVPRYMRADLWNTFFYQFLNIESCEKLPDLATIKKSFETILSEQSEELQVDMRYVANSVNGR